MMEIVNDITINFKNMTRLIEDKRPIQSVSCDISKYTWRIGKDAVTKIEVYEETGQMSYVPWIAIWKNNEVVLRMDAQGKSVGYI